MKKKEYSRVENIFICNDLEGKLNSVNLERVDWWKADDEDTEVHIFNCNFSIWLKVNEENFRNEYLKWKKKNG